MEGRRDAATDRQVATKSPPDSVQFSLPPMLTLRSEAQAERQQEQEQQCSAAAAARVLRCWSNSSLRAAARIRSKTLLLSPRMQKRFCSGKARQQMQLCFCSGKAHPRMHGLLPLGTHALHALLPLGRLLSLRVAPTGD